MDPLQQMGERDMTDCNVRHVRNSVQKKQSCVSVCLSGQWDFPAFDSLVIVELRVFDTYLIIQCHVSWFLKSRGDNRIKPIAWCCACICLFLLILFIFVCCLLWICSDLVETSGIENFRNIKYAFEKAFASLLLLQQGLCNP